MSPDLQHNPEWTRIVIRLALNDGFTQAEPLEKVALVGNGDRL